MDLMTTVFEQSGNIIDAFTVFFLYERVLGKEQCRFKRYISLIIILAGVEAFYYLSNLCPTTLVYVIGGFVAFWALSFTFKGKMSIRFIISASYAVIGLASEMIALLLIKPFVESYEGDAYAYIAGVMISKLLALLIIVIATALLKRTSYVNHWKHTVSILLCQTMSLVILVMLTLFVVYKNDVFDPVIGVIDILIVMLNISFYFIIDKLAESEAAHLHEVMLQNDINLQQRKYQNITMQYKSMRSYVHDINKHLRTIQSMLTTSTSDAQSYLDQTIAELGSIYIFVNTGNLVVDVIISDLLTRAKQNSIELSYSIDFDNNTVKVDNYAYTTILGNIADNAFNAAMTLTHPLDRRIDVRIATDGCNLVTIMRNTYDKTRIPEIVEGIGLENIKKAVSSLGGIYNYTILSDGMFCITVSIPAY